VSFFGAIPLIASSGDWLDRLNELHLLTPARVAVVVLAAVVVTIFVRRFVARFLRGLFDRAQPADRPRVEARGRALGTALRSALVGLIWSVVVVTIISEVGINIGGFVATATVVGGAIAFGAQTLIRDVIAGFFVLADDQFGVGDEVDLGHATGVVEQVTLRTARLRDSSGRIWHVPHGNVVRVANLSKESVAVLDVAVHRSMPVAQTIAIVTTLAEGLVLDPLVSPSLLYSPTIVGVTELLDDRFVVQVSVQTVLGQIDIVRRAWRVLTLEAFASGSMVAPPLTLRDR
jgi:moderate conductance mechanosensitive channel